MNWSVKAVVLLRKLHFDPNHACFCRNRIFLQTAARYGEIYIQRLDLRGG